MRFPPLTHEQQQRVIHVNALASGAACGCETCVASKPANRRESRKLVYRTEAFADLVARRLAPTLRARSVRGAR